MCSAKVVFSKFLLRLQKEMTLHLAVIFRLHVDLLLAVMIKSTHHPVLFDIYIILLTENSNCRRD